MLSQKDPNNLDSVHGDLRRVQGAVNSLMKIEGRVSQKDDAAIDPPEHLPEDIDAAFSEGAKCHAIGCYNAAGTMFRLCVDLATQKLLPAKDLDGLNGKIRRSLGLRLGGYLTRKSSPRHYVNCRQL